MTAASSGRLPSISVRRAGRASSKSASSNPARTSCSLAIEHWEAHDHIRKLAFTDPVKASSNVSCLPGGMRFQLARTRPRRAVGTKRPRCCDIMDAVGLDQQREYADAIIGASEIGTMRVASVTS